MDEQHEPLSVSRTVSSLPELVSSIALGAIVAYGAYRLQKIAGDNAIRGVQLHCGGCGDAFNLAAFPTAVV